MGDNRQTNQQTNKQMNNLTENPLLDSDQLSWAEWKFINKLYILGTDLGYPWIYLVSILYLIWSRQNAIFGVNYKY